MSKNLGIQFGEAEGANFEERIWSFEMPINFTVSAGEFAIVPQNKYDEIRTALIGIRNSVSAHPDNEENSEFADMISRCDKVLEFFIQKPLF